jgi:hypothetical protein
MRLRGALRLAYGLGIVSTQLACGRFWGHAGGILDYATLVNASEDGSLVGRHLNARWNAFRAAARSERAAVPRGARTVSSNERRLRW